MTKKAVKHDLPIQLGFFVYQYAKLRMLSFYYDVIDRFVDRADFCVLEMDTGNIHAYSIENHIERRNELI
jgi:hypothetical protein